MQASLVRNAVMRSLQKHMKDRPPCILDAALLGSTSGHYGDFESKLIDADLWIFTTKAAGAELSDWVRSFSNQVSKEINELYSRARFLCRAINGPYKPAPDPNAPTFFLHLLIDDMDSYNTRSAPTRYSWRKYSPVVDPILLARLAPDKVSRSDVLFDRWGLIDATQSLTKDVVEMVEIDLGKLAKIKVRFPLESFQYREFCTYTVMTAARNYCRALSIMEADTLRNERFATFFSELYSDKFLIEVAEEKMLNRQGKLGGQSNTELRAKTRSWCDEMVGKIQKEIKNAN